MKGDGKRELVIGVTRHTADGEGHPGGIPVGAGQRDELTVGTDYGCDVTIDDPRLPASFKFLKKRRGRGHTLLIPYFAEGEFSEGKSVVSIQSLIELGLIEESGAFYLLRLKPESRVEIRLGGVSLRLVYREKPPGPPAPPRHIPFISDGDYVFTFFLIVSAALHVGFVSYLNTIEAKELSAMEEIETMEPRFAKLIFKPRKQERDVAPRTLKKEEPREKKSAKKTRKKVKKKKTAKRVKKTPEAVRPPESSEEPREKKKELTGPTPTELALAREAVEAERKRSISEKVKGKGLLGVIGAKRGVLDELETDEVLMDLDNIITTARSGGGDGASDELGGIEFVKVEGLQVGLPSPEYNPRPARGVDEIIGEKKKLTSLTKQEKRAEKTALVRKEASVYKVVKSYIGGLKYLYNKSLRKDPTLTGTITATIVIDATGKVTLVKMTDSTIAYAPLEGSILKRIGLWKFEELKGAQDFTITYTFDFAPVG